MTDDILTGMGLMGYLGFRTVQAGMRKKSNADNQYARITPEVMAYINGEFEKSNQDYNNLRAELMKVIEAYEAMAAERDKMYGIIQKLYPENRELEKKLSEANENYKKILISAHEFKDFGVEFQKEIERLKKENEEVKADAIFYQTMFERLMDKIEAEDDSKKSSSAN